MPINLNIKDNIKMISEKGMVLFIILMEINFKVFLIMEKGKALVNISIIMEILYHACIKMIKQMGWQNINTKLAK